MMKKHYYNWHKRKAKHVHLFGSLSRSML